MKVLTQDQFITTEWSGGKTTQLYIYPENRNFADREFDFRLSTATVEIDESIFTTLEGVHRTLMVLSGEMKLIHENQHENLLKPFEQDVFEGDWLTKSIGQCVDFNLMTKGDVVGTVTHFCGPLNMSFSNAANLPAIVYVVDGVLKVHSESKDFNLKQNELLILHPNENIDCLSENDSNILLIKLT